MDWKNYCSYCRYNRNHTINYPSHCRQIIKNRLTTMNFNYKSSISVTYKYQSTALLCILRLFIKLIFTNMHTQQKDVIMEIILTFGYKHVEFYKKIKQLRGPVDECRMVHVFPPAHCHWFTCWVGLCQIELAKSAELCNKFIDIYTQYYLSVNMMWSHLSLWLLFK